MAIRLKDGTTTEDPRLGRLIQFDERSREYPVIRTMTSRQLQQPRTWTWTCPVWLDQKAEGACVSFSFCHELAARPFMVQGLTDKYAFDNYCLIQAKDPWPGGACQGMSPKYEGTSVLSGVKHFQDLGYYSGYTWAFSEEELMLAVSWKGPAVLGIAWFDSMYEPDSRGIISPTGNIVGGHAILCNGFSVKSQMYRLHNSWNRSYGVGGDCFISRADMKTLLAMDGEVCLPIRSSKVTL